jgi:tRNA threonylcarbamoyladenosine biosynthesis protein TsaB
MQILALDTSTEFLSLALSLDGRVFSRDIHAGQSHSTQILPVLRELLDEAKVSLNDLDGIAFGAGPGSFTGLRIACGVAQGLAFGSNLPVVEVSTLEALAQQSGEQKVITCLDARMGEVYYAAYEKNGQVWNEVHAPALYKPDQVPALIGNDWVGIGTGWTAYSEALQQAYAHQLKTAPLTENVHPTAVAIAELALPLFAAGKAKPAHEVAPIYIRNKVALKTSERPAK